MRLSLSYEMIPMCVVVSLDGRGRVLQHESHQVLAGCRVEKALVLERDHRGLRAYLRRAAHAHAPGEVDDEAVVVSGAGLRAGVPDEHEVRLADASEVREGLVYRGEAGGRVFPVELHLERALEFDILRLVRIVLAGEIGRAH